jgi:GH25 family lysozyme M1 (1,4-beta-N-acetylmuramidase)
MTYRRVVAPLLGVLLWASVAAVAFPSSAVARPPVTGGGWAHAGSPPGQVAPRAAVPAAAPAGYPVTGIDVSSNDHSGGRSIDWAGQANAGVRFAYVKATEGVGYVNPYFDSDYHAAKNQGLYVGAYHFARPDSGNPVGQADYFINNAQWTVDGATLVPFLDIEWPYASLGLPDCWGLTPAQLSTWIGAFVNEVQVRIGRPPMIYTNSNWWNPCTASDPSFANLPLDIAGYTTSPPPLPAGWNRFTLWQYADGPWPGDKDVFNGSLADLAAFAGVGNVPLTPAFDSVLARDPQGTLLVYPNAHGRGLNTLSPPVTVGIGWGGMNPIDAGDVNGDGHDDLLARDGAGVLRMYPNQQGTGTTLFGAPSTVGLGWGGMNVIEVGDVTRDHRVDIVARDGAGDLWLYPSSGLTGVNTFAGPTRIGAGWNIMNTIKLADVNGDGRVDLVARDGSGNLWLYPGTGGSGTGTFSAPIQLGVGWGGMTAISLGDMNGDGRPDLMARDSGGLLWLYPNVGGSGIRTFSAPYEIGVGWGAMSTLDLGSF